MKIRICDYNNIKLIVLIFHLILFLIKQCVQYFGADHSSGRRTIFLWEHSRERLSHEIYIAPFHTCLSVSFGWMTLCFYLCVISTALVCLILHSYHSIVSAAFHSVLQVFF